jgi:hypothetical protein
MHASSDVRERHFVVRHERIDVGDAIAFDIDSANADRHSHPLVQVQSSETNPKVFQPEITS